MTAPVSVGNLAAQAAEKLSREHLQGIEEGTIAVDDSKEVMEREGRSIMGKIRFSWRDEDRMIIEQIKAGANAAFEELYDSAFELLDNLYESVRVPILVNGQPQKDANSRVVWATDERGFPIQDWDNLTGQDIETALFKLQEIRFYVAPRLNELHLEAIMAKHIQDDSHADAYSSILDGTIGDRTAKANKVSRNNKYAAFFRYWLWSSGDTFMKEINSFTRLLEQIRSWHVKVETRWQG